MTDASPHSTSTANTASTPVFVATFAGILVATALFLVFDLFLAGVDHRESGAHAAAEYEAGRTLLVSGKPAEAGEHFGTAVAIDRHNVSYALALAEATLEQGRLAEAEATLRDLLERAENDGAVNLIMARVMVREKRAVDAKAYFHRAIFGRWGADSTLRRTAARLELIDALAQQGAARELLAELLPFEEASPDSIAFRVRLGQLLLAAGSPTRATMTFRTVLRRDPRNTDARAGMALVDSVVALDPTVREIGGSERYARSRALLARTIAAIGLCPRTNGPAISDSVRALLSASVASPPPQAEAETMTQAAIDLWASRPASCDLATRDTVLRLIHVHLAQL